MSPLASTATIDSDSNDVDVVPVPTPIPTPTPVPVSVSVSVSVSVQVQVPKLGFPASCLLTVDSIATPSDFASSAIRNSEIETCWDFYLTLIILTSLAMSLLLSLSSTMMLRTYSAYIVMFATYGYIDMDLGR